MARIITLVCDIHLARGEEVRASEAATSKAAEILKRPPHLCDDCYADLVAPLTQALEAGSKPAAGRGRVEKKVAATTQTRSKSGTRKTTSRSTRKTTSRTTSKTQGPKAADVRAWAADNGIEVSKAGKLPQDLITQYQAAKTTKDTETPKEVTGS